MAEEMRAQSSTGPDERGFYGPYGGAYVPETVVPALAELEEAYDDALALTRPSRSDSMLCCATSSAGPHPSTRQNVLPRRSGWAMSTSSART